VHAELPAAHAAFTGAAASGPSAKTPRMKTASAVKTLAEMRASLCSHFSRPVGVHFDGRTFERWWARKCTARRRYYRMCDRRGLHKSRGA
jgi:hypothetical protein